MNQLPYQIDTGFGLVEPFLPLQQQDTDYCEFSGEEDDMSERDLAENAQWKKIQQNTFTRWANEHLKLVSGYISDLERDLSDGLLLIALVEVLARKKLPKYNKKPSFRSQKLENVSLVLKFLQEDEGIKIVNIDSTHIVDCKLKLILGLIWTLILHYSISMPLWEGEDLNGTDSTPKQRLMNWIKTKLPPELPVRNFTTDWNDGKAIGALVDSVAPGLCPDWEDWDGRNNLGNATEAIDLASKWLDVPQLIQPEEMVNPNVDEQSVMTYLSQFPNAKIKPGAPLRPKHSINKIRVYGKGVESKSLPAGQATNFFIESSFPLLHERLDVFVENSKKQRVPVNITSTNNDHTHLTASYNPKTEGNHSVNVKVNGQHVPKSPFNVQVESEASTVSVFGPGVKPEGVPVNETTYFDVTFKNNNDECKPPKIIITDPDGNENVIPIKTYNLSSNHWRCEYVPKTIGPHSVNLYLGDNHAPIFHSKVTAFSTFDVKKVKASGRGLQPKGVRVQDIADFKIYAGGTEPEAPEIQILGPGKDAVPHKIQKSKDGTYHVEYQPVKEGRHVIIIKVAGQEIHKSPFEIDVGPYKKTAIEAFGPGLVGGIVNYPALFTVETNGETAALGFKILGPSQAKIEFHDNGDGSADVRYYPTAPGEYAIHILRNNEDIPRSPYIAEILPKAEYNPENVDVYGPGLEPNSLKQNVPSSFTVDTRKAGNADLNVTIRNGNAENVPVHVVEKSEGLYEFSYIPKNNSSNTIHVTFGGVAVKNSPYRVNVQPTLDVSKVSCYGPINGEDVKVNSPSYFTVDVKDAGEADLTARLINTDKNEEVPIKLVNNGDGTYTVQYKPIHVGTHSLSLCYGGVEVPGSPKFKVIPNIDVSQIKVEGLESRVYVGSPTDIVIDTKDPTLFTSDQVTCKITNPSGTQTKNIITNLPDGTYKISFTPFEEGRHTIDIFYDNIPVPGSPFTVNVKRGSDAKKCSAHGPGLEKGVLNKPNNFTIETKGAGTGGLSLAIEGPSEAKMTCKDNRDGSCNVEYFPTQAGEYEISVRFDDKPIPGSPFKVQVESDSDETLVTAFGPGLATKTCRSGTPAHFTIDMSKAKPAPVAVQITSDSKPVIQSQINDNGDGTFDVSYVPPNEGTNLQIKVLYDEKDIPGSPFPITVQPSAEPEKVKLYGKTLQEGRIPASLPTDIQIDTSEAGLGDLEVNVMGPDGHLRPVILKDKGNGVYKASFVPDDCGQYKLYAKYGGKDITKTPVAIQAHPVGQAKECEITRQVKETSIGEKNCIRIDTKNSGNGAVTCKIKSLDGKDIDVKTVDNGDGTISILFSILEPGEYTVNIKYGGQTIPGGTYKFVAKEYKANENMNSYENHIHETRETRETRTMEYKETQHQDLREIYLNNIPLLTTGGHVTAEIKMPSGKVDKPIIEDNHDGTVTIKYDPREEGVHELAVKFNGEHIQGSPYKIHVDSISSGYVTAYGSGLTHGVTGEPSNFTISTKGAGAGGLSMAVEGPSKAEINCHDNKDGTVSVSYLPTAPGEYKISIRFGDKHIKGSPFLAKVTGEGRKRNQISVGSCSEVSLPGKISDSDIRSLNASIQAPSGLEEPCFLKRLPTGNIGISFTPREVGEHIVSVKRLGNHITNSPFKINVCEREVGDAKKVKVTGGALKDGKTHTDNTFTVDTRNAGFGGLSLSIEGPSKAEIQCNDNSDGTLNISYKPTEPGYYIVNLKFADHHVDGSPFTVKVVGEGSNRQREKIQRQREAVPITEVGSQCKLTFKMPGITSFDLSATVTSPGGVTEDAEINEVKDGLYAVHFVPKELGIHTVSVKYKEIHIPGSPFQFTVGPYRDHGAHLVKAGGGGLERGEQGEINEFNVWTREAGSGQLAISVEGPSKAEINFADRKDGSCDVSYKVSEPGEYRIGLKFNDEHIPDSPFKVYISPAVGDAHLLEVAQFPEGAIQPDKPSQFIIRRNGAKGDLDAKIVGPSGIEDDCFVQIIDMEEYSVRFMPRENGVHKIHCKFNGVHIPGSPYCVKVGKDTADPAAVHAHGNGLNQVKTGVKTDFIVDTVNAGSGTLAVSIDGPSKVSMDCTEVEEGYKVRYTPLAPGDYYISIKYNNHHIVGSPYKVNSRGDAKQVADLGGQETSSVVVETVSKVAKDNHKGPVMPTFKSDASKVQSKGMGLKKAYIGKQNQFTVSAQNAGVNILFVGIHGPKGPCEEVFIKHQGHNQYAVNYIVRDRGDYLVIVKWGDDQIPGSPFKVEV